VADERETEPESTSILEEMRVSRRGFVRLSIAGIVGLPLFVLLGCSGSQDSNDSGGGDGNKKKGNKDDDGSGDGAGGY
jgi:hypothetical protein